MGSRRQGPVTLVGLALAVVAAGCGSGDGDDVAVSGVPGQPGGSASGAETVTVVARANAFDITHIEAEAGVPLEIVFDNNDTGVPHNLSVDLGDTEVHTEVASGPDVQELVVTIDEAGDYPFICAVHPAEMSGTIEVTDPETS